MRKTSSKTWEPWHTGRRACEASIRNSEGYLARSDLWHIYLIVHCNFAILCLGATPALLHWQGPGSSSGSWRAQGHSIRVSHWKTAVLERGPRPDVLCGGIYGPFLYNTILSDSHTPEWLVSYA